MNNKIQKILKKADLNYKKELVFIIVCNIFLVAIMILTYLMTGNSLFFIPFVFIIVLANSVVFYRYLFLYSKNALAQIKEFVILFRYLYLDINNQITVKDALINLREKASLEMNKRLEEFLNEMQQDSSLSPYLHFASSFSSVLIEETMINLYQYSKQLTSESLLHFNEAYFKVKSVIEEDEEKDSNRQYEFIKMTAIIGTAIIVILAIIVTIIVVEGYIHG